MMKGIVEIKMYIYIEVWQEFKYADNIVCFYILSELFELPAH